MAHNPRHSLIFYIDVQGCTTHITAAQRTISYRLPRIATSGSAAHQVMHRKASEHGSKSVDDSQSYASTEKT